MHIQRDEAAALAQISHQTSDDIVIAIHLKISGCEETASLTTRQKRRDHCVKQSDMCGFAQVNTHSPWQSCPDLPWPLPHSCPSHLLSWELICLSLAVTGLVHSECNDFTVQILANIKEVWAIWGVLHFIFELLTFSQSNGCWWELIRAYSVSNIGMITALNNTSFLMAWRGNLGVLQPRLSILWAQPQLIYQS